jgi:signal transduction histidine kinase
MIHDMRQVGQGSKFDSVVITARWVIILALSLWLASGDSLDVGILAVTLTLAAGNLGASVMQMANASSSSSRMLFVALDLLLAEAALFMGDMSLSLIWIAFLPIISGALYFRWLGALITALLNGLVQIGLTYVFFRAQFPLLPVFSLATGVMVGLGLALVNLKASAAGSGGRKNGAKALVNEKERDRRRTIFDLISALNASLNYQRVLESALDLSTETLADLGAPATDKLVGAVLLFTETNRRTPELQVATSRNMMPGDRDLCLPGASGLLAKAIDEGLPELTSNLPADPELGRVSSFNSCISAIGLPLRTGLDAYGLLLFAHPDPQFFSSDRKEVLDIVAKQAVVAIQNARLYQDLEQEKNRIMEVQEESRKKLARDLHDGPTQSVSAIAMRVNFARRLMERDIKAATDELYKIEDLARRTTKEIRHMLFTLRPLVLESQGLVAALESMAEKMRETFSQNVIIQADQKFAEALEAGKQAVVFYIAEEAVNNARKHANAAHIWVRLKTLRDGLSMLEIEDDGVGFDVNAVGASYETRGSLGMINLRERTELVNGVLRIDSAKGRGTRVQVVIPLTEEAADRIRRAV